MMWQRMKDERTEEQVKKDYNLGKEQERRIFQVLACPKFKIENEDEFGVVPRYQPDWFLFLSGSWYPTEIKYTEKELTYIDLKKNQAEELEKINGIYIQFTPTRFVIVKAKTMAQQKEVIGYCNKTCFRLESPLWKRYKQKNYEM